MSLDGPIRAVHIEGPGLTFQLALFAGAEPSALSAALLARAGLAPDTSFFLTARLPDQDESAEPLVVPLSSSLPSGLHLQFHMGKAGEPRAAGPPPPPPARSASSQSCGSPADDLGGTPVAARGLQSQPSNDLELVFEKQQSPRRITSAQSIRGRAIRRDDHEHEECDRGHRNSPDRSHLGSSGMPPKEGGEASSRRSMSGLLQKAPSVTWGSPNSHGSYQPPLPRYRVGSFASSASGAGHLRSPLLRSPSPGSSHGRSLPPICIDEGNDVRDIDTEPLNERGPPMTAVETGTLPDYGEAWTFRRLLNRRSLSLSPERPPVARARLETQAAEMEMVTALERFNRLSTDLANERTLLAWVRTCLAAVRTGLSFLGVTAVAEWWISLYMAQWGMLLLIVLASFFGAVRYYRLKAILEYKVPPRYFGRLSLTPMNALVVVASVATASGLAAQTWVK